MTRFTIAVLAIIMLFLAPSFAANTDSDTLVSYEQSAKVSAMGMCDSMRSTLVRFSDSDFTMEMFAPAADSGVRFYVVTKNGGKEYFIKRFKVDSSIEVRKLSPMDWSVELMPLSRNYFIAHFFPERNHDCLAAPLK